MMRLTPAVAALLLLGVAQAKAQPAGQVEVTVAGVRQARGTIRVAICAKAEFLQPHCAHTGKAPAREGEVHVTVKGVPPGVYAAQAFQDINDNDHLDTNWLGVPEEGVGFSNDAAIRFGPPNFAEAAFQLTASGGQIRFRLRYLDQR